MQNYPTNKNSPPRLIYRTEHSRGKQEERLLIFMSSSARCVLVTEFSPTHISSCIFTESHAADYHFKIRSSPPLFCHHHRTHLFITPSRTFSPNMSKYMTWRQKNKKQIIQNPHSQSRCFFLGPIISSVVALHTDLANPCPARLCRAASNRSFIVCPAILAVNRACLGWFLYMRISRLSEEVTLRSRTPHHHRQNAQCRHSLVC